ncbi:MAG: hypothetical protein P0Y53_21380 [Candidatus Pseudobacter hemicellulosilyticus]|uniref:Ig-like domain-containing protein n=1 Tax=Candidatus Pseudobacter hemicellulosilyticus TaxID=3121375 RepID=A0AAJ5WPV0_9BACT|nr:MAG: hypothetical protein P0Y53_21380 [Pseudobacter sp.]
MNHTFNLHAGAGPFPKAAGLLLAALLTCAAAFSQNNYSGLLNKELTPEIGGAQVIGNIIDRLLYGNFSGSVTKVKVLDDAEQTLTVGVSFIGYTEGYIHVLAADGDANTLPSFPAQTIALDKDKKDVTLTLRFDRKAWPENQPFSVPNLVVLVSKNDKATHGVRTLFKLNKQFVVPYSPENVVLPIRMIPIGSAASLPARITGNPGTFKPILPQRNIYNVIKNKQVLLFKVDTAAARVKPATATPVATGPAIRTVARPTPRVINPDVRMVSVLAYPVLTPVSTGGSSAPPPNTNPQGPSDSPLSFWGDFILSDVDFESQNQLTNVSLTIYPDKNPASGVFYYLPIAYDVKYDKERGFAFNMDYGTVRDAGGDNRVRMSGTLSSGISLNEIQFIKALMDAYKAQNPGLKLERPMPLPISETPVITLGDELKNFGISNVNINNTSSITDPVEFSWMTDGTTATELENLLRANSGIIGKMKIKPQGTTLGVQEIPVRIRLIDENTFGRFNMSPTDFRNKNWRNETPFPVRLKYLHCMVIDKNDQGKDGPIIYSWDLGNTQVPATSQVKFNADTVPTWLDNHKGKQARIWLEYSVVDTCSPCNEGVFRGIVQATSRPQLNDVVFRLLPFFEEYKISYLDVEMKSSQGSPSGSAEVSFPALHITKDSADQVLGKLYLASGVEPAFDYRVTVVTKEGNEMKSAWIRHISLSVPFGSFQLKNLFPSFNQ